MAKPQKNKQKINPLNPAAREKKRYLAYEIKSQKPIPQADQKLIKAIKQNMGVFISAKAGIMGLKYSQKKQRGIIRVNRKFTDHLRSCFVMIKSLDQQPVLIRTLKISGMINKLKNSEV